MMRALVLLIAAFLSGLAAAATSPAAGFLGPPLRRQTVVARRAGAVQETMEKSPQRRVSPHAMNRALAVLVTVLMPPLFASEAFAARNDPALVGTKEDPAYQKCLSNCLYFCTKPKGEATKLRAECLPGCKEKCATNANQKLLGVPKKAASGTTSEAGSATED